MKLWALWAFGVFGITLYFLELIKDIKRSPAPPPPELSKKGGSGQNERFEELKRMINDPAELEAVGSKRKGNYKK